MVCNCYKYMSKTGWKWAGVCEQDLLQLGVGEYEWVQVSVTLFWLVVGECDLFWSDVGEYGWV